MGEVSWQRTARVLPAGERAVLIEWPDAGPVTQALRWLTGPESASAVPPSGVEFVPAERTLLVLGAPAAALREWWAGLRPAVEAGRREVEGSSGFPAEAEVVVVPVRYDGPDLAEVAQQWSCSTDEVVARHQESVLTVAFCGFAPGFGYCVGGAWPMVARRRQPRPQVPAGAVALAGSYSGIYPRASPGGWQLIGTTDAVLWDVTRDEPALLVPGRRIRHEAV